MIPRRLLSVDPAATSGWALWRNGVLSSWGSVVIAHPDDVPGRIVRRWWDSHPRMGGNAEVERHNVLVVESHGARMRNAVTAERLIEHRRTWEVVAELAGWTVERVLVQTWQAAILGRGRAGAEKIIARQIAEREAARAGGFDDAVTISEDAADAICVGKYWLMKKRLEAAGGPKR